MLSACHVCCIYSNALSNYFIAWNQTGHTTFFMLNSNEHEIYPAHTCLNVNNCWHFNIYEQDIFHAFNRLLAG